VMRLCAAARQMPLTGRPTVVAAFTCREESGRMGAGLLDLETPMNLSTTNDIIGGNSGSPLIDKDANIVGLIFDGNIFSLGGDYGYDPTANRSVAVDSRALLEGLRKVYHFDRIADEIEAGRK